MLIYSIVVKLADLPSRLGRLAVCHAGVAERQLEAKGRRGELTTSPASLEDTIWINPQLWSSPEGNEKWQPLSEQRVWHVLISQLIKSDEVRWSKASRHQFLVFHPLHEGRVPCSVHIFWWLEAQYPWGIHPESMGKFSYLKGHGLNSPATGLISPEIS